LSNQCESVVETADYAVRKTKSVEKSAAFLLGARILRAERAARSKVSRLIQVGL